MTSSELQVGIALSAGGAAAMAQVGVLEELGAAGIPIQVVAGTSAGAMVGAAFAADHLAGFRDAMCTLTRGRVLRLFDPTLSHGGLFEGRRAMELIQDYVGDRIEELPRRYAAVATDLHTGERVLLQEGPVLEAIRASIAIPALFTPRRRAGRWLVDGGLVDPIPVGVARRLGAEFVIAANVLPLGQLRRAESPSQRQASEPSTVDVILSASRVIETQVATSRLREHPSDWLLQVPVPDVGIFDFQRSAELVEAGREAARKALPGLQKALEAAVPFRRRLRRWPRRLAKETAQRMARTLRSNTPTTEGNERR